MIKKKKKTQFTQFKPRTEPNRMGVNQFTPVQFGSQFGSAKLVKVQFAVQQKWLRTELN